MSYCDALMKVYKYTDDFLNKGLISNSLGYLIAPVSVRMTIVRKEMQLYLSSLMSLA